METTSCPVCNREVKINSIEVHVNSCLFLNSRNTSDSPKRKRDEDILFKCSKVAKSSPTSINNQFDNYTSDPSDSKSDDSEKVTLKDYSFKTPLAEALRPTDLNDFIGQEQAVGNRTILRKLMETGDIPSLILWGPPGCGKTTLANIIKEFLSRKKTLSNEPPVRFVKLYATMAGVNDVKNVISSAKNELQMFHRRTILFMDEIHRFNKSQQDIFLPHIESGTITLIGATTENPSFSLNNALLSRCRVITLDKLSSSDILTILLRAVNNTGGCVTTIVDSTCSQKNNSKNWIIDNETVQWLADISDGDARIALNSLQMAIQSKVNINDKDNQFTTACITLSDIKDGIKRSHLLYDKKGEEHYNLISALHKSIRASDDNAALYWLTRMLESGEDPIYIARRLIRAASEDIGLADSNALVLAVATMQGCQLIGMPECDVLLAHLTVYLARCPKSTEVYRAQVNCRSNIKQHKGPLPSVPLHLRNAPTKLMKDLGYAQNYNMKHKDESGLIYLPEGLENLTFFNKT